MSVLVRALHALAELRKEARASKLDDETRRIGNAIEALLELPAVRDDLPTEPNAAEVTETRAKFAGEIVTTGELAARGRR
jgi:hypothetical protein